MSAQKTSQDAVAFLRNTIIGRSTEKVIATPNSLPDYSDIDTRTLDDFVRQSIEDAGMAPFHYDRNLDETPEPWRFYLLEHSQCRLLADELGELISDLKPSSKVPGLLRGCGCVVLVNWIPLSAGEAETDPIALDAHKQQKVNDEHLAATAAAVQNLLLLLTAGGLGTYWSSGGGLGQPPVFEQLGIDNREKLLAAVFVEYPSRNAEIFERIPGKNRPRRSAAERWFRDVMLQKT